MTRFWVLGLISLLFLSGSGIAQQGSGQDDKILERGDKLLGEAKSAYEDARTNSSGTGFVDAGFKLEEARIKVLVLQEIGTPENQKLATDRLRAINQLSKLIHDGRVAISGSPADSVVPKPSDPAPVPGTPAGEPPAKPEAGSVRPPVDVMKRASAPEAARQRESEKAIKDLFKEQYSKKSPADRKALARTLMDQAAKSESDPPAQWVLWREAQDISIQLCDIRTILEAIDLMTRVFDIDALSMRNAALAAAGKAVKTPEDAAPLSDALFLLIDEYIVADQYDSAEKTANSALLYARRTNDPGTVARATIRSKEVTEAKTLFQGMKKQLEVQAKNPDDPGANLEIGRFLCFVKGSWDLGLRFIAKGSDATLKALAAKELAYPDQAVEQVAIADVWYDLSEKEKSPLRKSQLLAHARVIYEGALPGSAALVRTKIEKRLESMSQGTTTTGPAIDLLRLVDLKTAGGDWTCDGRNLTCRSKIRFQHVQILYEPPDEYDLTVVAERKEGLDPIYIGLAHGTTQFYVAVDDQRASLTGLGFVDGKHPDQNETTARGKLLEDNKPGTIICSVRKGAVSVTVDGKKVITFKAGFDHLSNMPELTIPNKRALFIGTGDARYTVSKLTLTTIAGIGKPLK